MTSLFNGVQLAVFDLDGTLIDAFADIAKSANYVRSLNGLSPLTVSEVKRHVGHGARALVAGVLATDDPAIVDENHKRLVTYYSAQTTTTAEFYPGVVDALRELRSRGIKTAIASNKPDEVTGKVIAALGATEYFDLICGESPRLPRKPAPDLLVDIMQRFLVKTSETIMVGDSLVDVQFGHSAGLPVVAVTYGQCTREELQNAKAEAIIDSMGDLPGLIA